MYSYYYYIFFRTAHLVCLLRSLLSMRVYQHDLRNHDLKKTCRYADTPHPRYTAHTHTHTYTHVHTHTMKPNATANIHRCYSDILGLLWSLFSITLALERSRLDARLFDSESCALSEATSSCKQFVVLASRVLCRRMRFPVLIFD